MSDLTILTVIWGLYSRQPLNSWNLTNLMQQFCLNFLPFLEKTDHYCFSLLNTQRSLIIATDLIKVNNNTLIWSLNHVPERLLSKAFPFNLFVGAPTDSPLRAAHKFSAFPHVQIIIITNSDINIFCKILCILSPSLYLSLWCLKGNQ